PIRQKWCVEFYQTIKTLTALQRRPPLMLQRFVRSSVLSLGRLVVLVFKVFSIVLMGFRALKVENVLVNNAFLLSNGFIIVHWRVKDMFWITVQGKWVGSRSRGLMVVKSDGESMISIRIQGLFSSYNRSFHLHPIASVIVGEPDLLYPKVSLQT